MITKIAAVRLFRFNEPNEIRTENKNADFIFE